MHKSFGTSAALNHVQFELKACEIHGLLGGNGAGKTTLMNILYGLYRMDSGEIVLHDQPVEILSPRDAIQHGIGMVHQHFLQIQNFSVIENVVLGSEIKNKLTMNLEAEEKKLRELCERFGLEIDLDSVVEDLPMGTRQKVEILKALYRGVEVLILDEPTTNLTPQEVDDLFQSLRVMVTAGMSIVFITHKLREVLSVCDRISVLRNGENVLTLKRSEATEEAFIRGMVGDEMKIEDSVIFAEVDKVLIEREVGERSVLNMERVCLTTSDNLPALNNITLEIHEKEILGIAGVAGNGQRELAEVIFGVQPATSGTILLNGEEINGKATQELLAEGIAYIPEDRMHDGFLPKGNLAQNLILGHHKQEPYSAKGFMNWKKVFAMSWDLIRQYNIKTSGPGEAGGNLSGGNIQRVLIARAFSRPSKLLIMHNPTRGLDIPSMDFVYNRLLERKQQGTGIILLSENLDELLLLCDRIAVVYRGEIVGVLERNKFEKYEIGRMMSGVRTND
ncbi:MAG: ABC transporter ATP-binding protein [Anaerolineaceae bacterium]|nr:ABC transporter ATP-binding protein [Anaerolineaceae bacterium]